MDLEDVGALAMRHEGVKRKGHDGCPKWYVDDRLVARPVDATSVAIRAGFTAVSGCSPTTPRPSRCRLGSKLT